MARVRKDGRQKRLWDFRATADELDRLLEHAEVPKDESMEQTTLHLARAACRDLEEHKEALAALDRLRRLMHSEGASIRKYAQSAISAYRSASPLMKSFSELLGEGKAHELWPTWFVACELPRRLSHTLNDLDRLLFAIGQYTPSPLDVPGYETLFWRRAIVMMLRRIGYDVAKITRIVDPAGYKANPIQARDRVRKEVKALEVDAREARTRMLAETNSVDHADNRRVAD